MKKLFFFILIAYTPLYAQDELPAEVSRVMQFIIKTEYLELYGGQYYKIRLRGYEVIDIDRDGTIEVFLMIYPHYHQTAPIVIYQIKGNNVSRVFEALAPGPLVNRSGEYLDCHTMGLGIDAANILDKENKQVNPDTIIAWANKRGKQTNIVVYNKFIHIGVSEGKGSFVDMRHQKEFQDALNCEKFQFSCPDEMISGYLNDDSKNKYLICKVKDRLFIYKINKIRPDGIIDKEMKEYDLPDDFVKFDKRSKVINYFDKENNSKILNISWK